jgi:spore coat protein U-like protein
MNKFSFNNVSDSASPQAKKHTFGLSLSVVYCVLFFLVPNHPSIADTSTSSLQVTAMVASHCVVKNGTLSFGTYDPLDANSQQALQSVGTFDVQCVKQSSAILQLSSGNHPANAVGTSRAMANADGSSYLSYEIYTNPSSNAVWNSANTVSYTANDAHPATIDVYGKIPANQLVADGAYSDTVMITANF